MTRCLFYPCCGSTDFAKAVAGFADVVDEVHGADPGNVPRELRKAWRLEPLGVTPHPFTLELEPNGPEGIRNLQAQPRVASEPRRHDYLITGLRSDRTLRLVWHEYDAIEALRWVPDIGVFFFRRDRPGDGEGSSGIRWLGNILLRRVLAKMPPGALLVTDGAGMNERACQAPLWTAPRKPNPIGLRFAAFGRSFECLRIFCSERVPTLVWRVD